jgi:hypothetical protein
MAKSNKTRKSKSKKKAPIAAEPTRRDTLKLLRNGGIGVLAVGAVGYFGVGSYQAYAAEHDLSRVGQGSPVVVQIHDPSCPICTALQKEARQAVKALDDEMVFLVADITTDVGRKFAVSYGVGHVTLLLFDGAGTRKQTLQGMRESEELTPIFQEHFAAG